MGSAVMMYLAVTGGVSAGLQVTRGVVRGVTRLIEGEPRAAVGEVIGGVVAPVASVLNQGSKLTGEICGAVLTISACGEEETPSWLASRRHFEPAAADGVPG
jgi:hypothetical protein